MDTIVTLLDNTGATLISADAEVDPNADVCGHDTADKLAILVRLCFGSWPDREPIARSTPTLRRDTNEGMTLYVSRFRGVGTVFVIVLLFVAAITNLSVRGLWTVFVVLSLLMLTIIFQLAGWWGSIFLGSASCRSSSTSAATSCSAVLFVLWLVNVFIFDRQTYMIFTPGRCGSGSRSAAARRSTTRAAWSSKSGGPTCSATGCSASARAT